MAVQRKELERLGEVVFQLQLAIHLLLVDQLQTVVVDLAFKHLGHLLLRLIQNLFGGNYVQIHT